MRVGGREMEGESGERGGVGGRLRLGLLKKGGKVWPLRALGCGKLG